MLPKLRTGVRRVLSPDILIPVALFLFALALRAYGVRGSLPYVAHPEELKLVNSAIHIVKTGDLNPHLYIWPSLYTYLEALVVKAHLVWGVFRGYYAGPESLPDGTHSFTLATGLYLWVRTFTALVGAAGVALLYVVGRDMFNGSRRVGVAAALMIAVSPLHVEYSLYALTDVPLGVAGTLVLWASYRLSRASPNPERALSRDPLLWWSILCGLLVGVATGTKYNGLYLMIVPLTAWLLARSRPENSQQRRTSPIFPATSVAGPTAGHTTRLLLSLAAIPLAALAGFLLCEPYAILDWHSFYTGVTFQVEAYVPARTLGQVLASVGRHLADLNTLNGYMLLPAALGAVVLFANAPVRNRAWLLVPFPILYTLAMSCFSHTFVRNLIVTLPFLALAAGYAIDLAATQFTSTIRSYLSTVKSLGSPLGTIDFEPWILDRRVWGVVRWGAVALALALILAEPFRISTTFAGYMHGPDARNLAWEWIQQRMR